MKNVIHLIFVLIHLINISICLYLNSDLINNILIDLKLIGIYEYIPSYFLINKICFLVLSVFIIIHYLIIRKIRPRYRVNIANKLILDLRKKGLNEAQLLSYLRKIDPFVFEELLLTAFKEQGCKIKRNKKYTGDGGLDGQVWINKKHYLIQAKRYKAYINKQHMKEFILLNEKEKTEGLFIHTGKTGKETRLLARENNIKIISGSSLYSLIMNYRY